MTTEQVVCVGGRYLVPVFRVVRYRCSVRAPVSETPVPVTSVQFAHGSALGLAALRSQSQGFTPAAIRGSL